MKYLLYISLFVVIACEEVVIVDLPNSQNLVVVQGWITDSLSNQPIRLTRSNSFADQNQVLPIEDAQVIVQSRTGEIFNYSYTENGYYHANTNFNGIVGREYRILALIDTLEIRSDWDEMPEKVEIGSLQLESFQENDPNNPSQQITIFYPKVNAVDPMDVSNYYRWVFFKNGDILTDPDPITIQNDRLFDGNVIPNNFQLFEYGLGEVLAVQLISISQNTHRYLALLRSQITTLGTSGGTTPAVVTGNISYVDDESLQVLGYFGAVAISERTVTVE